MVERKKSPQHNQQQEFVAHHTDRKERVPGTLGRVRNPNMIPYHERRSPEQELIAKQRLANIHAKLRALPELEKRNRIEGIRTGISDRILEVKKIVHFTQDLLKLKSVGQTFSDYDQFQLTRLGTTKVQMAYEPLGPSIEEFWTVHDLLGIEVLPEDEELMREFLEHVDNIYRNLLELGEEKIAKIFFIL